MRSYVHCDRSREISLWFSSYITELDQNALFLQTVKKTKKKNKDSTTLFNPVFINIEQVDIVWPSTENSCPSTNRLELD